MNSVPDRDPLNEAPLLRSIHREDPFVVPEGFFERFPERMVAAVKEQPPRGVVRTLAARPWAWRWAGGLAAAAALLVLFVLRPFAPAEPLRTTAAMGLDVQDVEETLVEDAYLLAQLGLEPASAPGVQHDLDPEELTAYLLEHPDLTLDLLNELQ